MIPRYTHPDIARIWSLEETVKRWGEVEDAALKARQDLGNLPEGVYKGISGVLAQHAVDIEWWLAREKEIGHDYQAFVEERQRHLPVDLQHFYHEGMTSYDGEEPARAKALRESSAIVLDNLRVLFETTERQAIEYRYLPFLERTHEQWAKPRSFGGRILTWYAAFAIAHQKFLAASEFVGLSKMSGAIGNFAGGLPPEIQTKALELLDLEPFHGATQIVPRVVHTPLAQAIALLASMLEKIAVDIRRGARSGYPINREPFGKKQKGSSKMPQKKNPVLCEQMTGMARMARGYASTLTENIVTTEGRTIEESCVERVIWPDLFHVVMRMISVMTRVIGGLEVYPDNMLRELVDSRGTYAADEARDFLAKRLAPRGIGADEAYRIAQLAAFCAFEPMGFWKLARTTIPQSHQKADELLYAANAQEPAASASIEVLLRHGLLFPVESLDISRETVERWNDILQELFTDGTNLKEWAKLFTISHALKHEDFLFEKVFGVES